MESSNYFVPVDFSTSSFKAVQYAMMLAQLTGGHINLFHVFDPNEMPDSDNPVVVGRTFDKLTSHAEKKMESLREMIRSVGVSSSFDLSFGKLSFEFAKQCSRIKADYIVIGKEHMARTFSKNGIKLLKLPTFVVPESTVINTPYNILLATDLKSIQAEGLSQFLTIANKTCEALKLLHISKKPVINGHEVNIRHKFDEIKKIIDVKTDFTCRQGEDVTTGILDYTKENSVDLLCTIKRKGNGLINKLFPKSISAEILAEADVPVLVFSGV